MLFLKPGCTAWASFRNVYVRALFLIGCGPVLLMCFKHVYISKDADMTGRLGLCFKIGFVTFRT